MEVLLYCRLRLVVLLPYQHLSAHIHLTPYCFSVAMVPPGGGGLVILWIKIPPHLNNIPVVLDPWLTSRNLTTHQFSYSWALWFTGKGQLYLQLHSLYADNSITLILIIHPYCGLADAPIHQPPLPRSSLYNQAILCTLVQLRVLAVAAFAALPKDCISKRMT